MPTLYLVIPRASGGGQISAADINQLVNTLTGNQNTPVSIKNTDPIAYTLQLQNTDAAGKALLIYGPDGTTVLARVQGNGVVASPDGTAAAPVVTTTHAQTLTNKTLTAPTLSGAVVVSAATLGALINGALSSNSAVLGADVTMVTPTTTWYSGPSLSLVAGTWLVLATLSVLTPAGAAGTFDGRLFDGAGTTYAATSTTVGGASQWGDIALATIIPLGATTTITAQATSNIANSIIKAGAAISGLAASRITAVRIA